MRRILFVDDEPNILQGLQRMLRSMRHEWEMTFVGSGQEALQILEKSNYDVVVSDMRMPVMDGAQLFAEVQRLYPKTVRIILSGYSNQELILKSVGSAHQYLAKPCDAEKLKGTVARTCALRELISAEGLELIVSKMQTLPSVPSLYTAVVKELQNPNSSLKQIGEMISKDLGMAAKILQLVNSAFFGLRNHVSSPAEAVNLLGIDTVKALVFTVHIFSLYDKSKLTSFSIEELWRHSLTVGSTAHLIAKKESQNPKSCDDALMAGLLHDSGKLVLAANLPEQFGRAITLANDKTICLEEAEREVFGASHAEVGGYLLGLWGLPDPIVEAVSFHHHPGRSLGQTFEPLTAVHAANAMDHEKRSNPTHGKASSIDMDYLVSVKMEGRIPEWGEMCN
jgi:HD-like signal output (HDOD) protein